MPSTHCFDGIVLDQGSLPRSGRQSASVPLVDTIVSYRIGCRMTDIDPPCRRGGPPSLRAPWRTRRSILAMTSAASAICGTHRDETKLVASMR